MVRNGAFSHKIDYVSIYFGDSKSQMASKLLHCFKVTAILVNWGIYLVVELHWEGSASTAGLF